MTQSVILTLVILNFVVAVWNLYLAHQRTTMQREEFKHKRKKREKKGGKHDKKTKDRVETQ